MSDATQPSEPDATRTDDADLDETPAAAGGHDDGRPAQGEGDEDSY